MLGQGTKKWEKRVSCRSNKIRAVGMKTVYAHWLTFV